MSRAVVICSPSGGRPEAFTKVVEVMPSSRARAVISWANCPSVPPSRSAMATATSLAEWTVMAGMASATVSVSPGWVETLEGIIEKAWGEMVITSPIRSRPVASASKVR